MLNQIVLVGRISNNLEIRKEEEKKSAYIKLAVPRSFKNADGVYDTDFLDVMLYGCIAENTVEYCKVGDLVGVKGRLQSDNEKMQIVAEKLTFLSSKKGNENES